MPLLGQKARHNSPVWAFRNQSEKLMSLFHEQCPVSHCAACRWKAGGVRSVGRVRGGVH